MPIAARLESMPARRDRAQVVRDFAVLVGAALAIGLTAGLGMMLTVLVLS